MEGRLKLLKKTIKYKRLIVIKLVENNILRFKTLLNRS